MRERTRSNSNWRTRIFTLFLAVILVIGFSTTVSAAESELTVTPAVDSDGDGYYEISTAEELLWFSQQVNSGNSNRTLNAVLTTNIDLSSVCGLDIGNWLPIGNKYSGHFNGQGYTVSNLYMTGNDQYIGLFGYVKGATIENVTVTGSISSTFSTFVDLDNYVYLNGAAGGIVAHMDDGTIRNCYVNMTVSGGYDIGGICGLMYDGLIEDCTVNGNIICNALPDQGSGFCIGGIVGCQFDGTVRGCVNRATASAKNGVYFGGIAGLGTGDAIENCLNYGSFNAIYDATNAGGTTAGGIVGSSMTVIRNCGNFGSINISGTGEWTGGIVGVHQTSSGIVENCYNVGSIMSSDGKFGLIVGIAANGAIDTNCYYLSDTETADGGRTAAQFASGQVAYELNGSTTADDSVWKQTLGTDDYPVLSGALVYASSKCNDATSAVYSNTQMDAIVHTGAEYKLISNNDGTHNVVYSCCEAVAAENVPCASGADCTKDSTCGCGYVVAATHDAHDFSSAYTYDDNGHWQQCVHCQQVSAMEDHTAQSSGDCTVATACECGYVFFEAKEHSAATLIFHTDEYHYEGCSVCTQPINDVRTPHDFSVLESNEYEHWYTCSGCDISPRASIVHNAKDDGDCTTAVICECGHVITEAKSHSGGTATCTEQAVCENCGTQYGELGAEKHSGTADKLVSNDNGTHNVLWNCCGAVVTENVTCTFENDTCACGYVNATVSDPVAEINGKQYVSLSSAVEAAQPGDTIKLLADVEVTAETTFAMKNSVTLDLNGFTFKGDDGKAIFSGTAFTIKNGKVTGVNGSTLDYYPITIDSASNKALRSASNIVVEGLTFTDAGLKIRGGATVTLKDNTITANQNKFKYAVWAYGSANVTIESGTYFGGKNGYDVFEEGKANITLYGGTYKVKNNEGYMATDADLVYSKNNDGTYTVKAVVKDPYAAIGDALYATLSNAIAAAKSGDTIILVKDCSIDMDGATVTLPDDVTLDLNGKTLTVPFQQTLFAGENITIKDGTITTGSTENYVLYIMRGSFTIENITTTNGINVQAGDVTLKDVNATCPNKYYAVYGGETADVTIQSGNYKTVRNASNLYGNVTACGGNFSKKPADQYIAVGYIAAKNDDGTYTVRVGTLQDMIDAADVGSTVTLTRNYELDETIIINKSLTLDLGEYTISSIANVAVYSNGGNLTIDGTTGGITTTGTVAVGQDNGTCTINGGSFKASGDTHDVANGQPVKYRYTLDNSNTTENGITGSFVINGGKFYGFNPACMSINPDDEHDHDSIADGKTAVLEDGWFTVAEGELKYTIICDCDSPAPSHQYCYASFKDALAALESNKCKWDKIVPITDVAYTGILHVGSGENKEKVIVIDAGHQIAANTDTEPNGPGSTTMKTKVASGTYGRFTGVTEYQLNLDVALALRDELLSRGYTVVMVRETNEVDISNAERAQVANAWGADALIRIHANGSDNASTTGAEGLCQTTNNPYPGCKAVYDESLALTDSILSAYCTKTGMTRRYIWKTDTMTGINWANVPATILEMGYMTNEADDTYMATAEFKAKAAEGIADGLDAYFG